MKILIVDDEEAICLRLQRELEKVGHDVFYRTSPLVVLEELKKARSEGRPVNLLLLNVQMPGMSGLELVEKCREITDDFVSIIITGHGDYEKASKSLKLGVYDYLKFSREFKFKIEVSFTVLFKTTESFI